MIHLGCVSIPSISLDLPWTTHIFQNIIRCDLLLGELCSHFSRAFGAFFLFMAHCSTVLAGSFSKCGGLVSFLASIVPLIDISLGLIGGYFDELSSSLRILGVPGELFDIVGCIFFPVHLLYNIIQWHRSINMNPKISSTISISLSHSRSLSLSLTKAE